MWHVPGLLTLACEPCHKVGGSRLAARSMATMRKKRRKPLDEYDRYSVGLRLKVWRDAVKGEGFFPCMFEDMSPAETSKTVFLAVKMSVQSKSFWDRASLAVGDIASALNARQLTSTCYALSVAGVRDPATIQALVPVVASNAPKLRPGDLAVMVQSFARMVVRNTAIMTSLDQAIQSDTRLNCKGLSMVVAAFATLKFQSEGFYSRLRQWAEPGGMHRCSSDETISILQSLSVLLAPGKTDETIVVAISKRISNILEELEPGALVATVTALGKLRASDPALLDNLQRVVLHDMNNLHIISLPVVLDSMINMHLALIGENCSLLDCPERRFFYAQLLGRLSRQLIQLRPQSVCRILQALERADIVDTRLLANTYGMLPERLGSFPAEELLKLLQAYAKAANFDGLMVNFLRRALLPVKIHRNENDFKVPIDNSTLAQLDDVGVAAVAESFASLGHWEGVLSVLAAVGPPGNFEAGIDSKHGFEPSHSFRQLVRSCEISVAASASSIVLAPETWDAALENFAGIEPTMGSLEIALSPMVREAWAACADTSNFSADELLLALAAFPTHMCHALWVEALAARLNECRTSLLPSILLSDFRSSDHSQYESLKVAAEDEFLMRLPSEGSASMPVAAIVGALRALAQRAQSGPQNLEKMAQRRHAAEALVESLVKLNDDSQVGGKSLVRALQSFRALQLEPLPVLVQLFSQQCSTLLPSEFVVALRELSTQSILKAGCSRELSCVATRAMALLRSSRQAWELESLCRKLDLDIGEPDMAVEAEDDEENPTPDTILSKEQQLRKRY